MPNKLPVQVSFRMTESMHHKLKVEAGSTRDIPSIIRQKIDFSDTQSLHLKEIKNQLSLAIMLIKDLCFDNIPVQVRMRKIVENYPDDKRYDEAMAIKQTLEEKVISIAKHEANHE